MSNSQEEALKKVTAIYKEATEKLSYFNVKQIANMLTEAEQLIKQNFPRDYNKILSKRREEFDFAA